MNDQTSSSLFDELRGEELSAVTFVQDYLQLWFGGPGINVTNPLTVKSAAEKITAWQPGFRDLLCAQIAKIVAAVEHRPEDALVIHFTDDSSVSVSLQPDDYTSAEAFYAHGFSNGPSPKMHCSRNSSSTSVRNPTSPNHALQRTAPRVTVAAISSSNPSPPSHHFP